MAKSSTKNKVIRDCQYTSEKVEVKPSPGKGRGVFARVDIVKGDLIECAPVLMIRQQDEAFVLSSQLGHYAFGVLVGKDEYSCLGLGYTSFYNHAKRCNADYVTSPESIIIYADKNIKAGTEITIDYGWLKDQYKEVGMKG